MEALIHFGFARLVIGGEKAVELAAAFGVELGNKPPQFVKIQPEIPLAISAIESDESSLDEETKQGLIECCNNGIGHHVMFIFHDYSEEEITDVLALALAVVKENLK